MKEIYLESARRQFEYYRYLGEKTLQQVPRAQYFWSPDQESNSLAVLVRHLWGNMLSRWTDFLHSDGEKSWRDRDAEFEVNLDSPEEVVAKWKEGWDCVMQVMYELTPDDLERTVLIRNQEHSVVEAINRQMDHYAYHVGQMVYLGKMICGSNWTSLSIPKGGSKAFNEKKSSQGVHGGHFTEDIK
ncbi:MAG: DUF1572 family protein [Bacteroidia bacterium]|nr:DUF1572 family protein [Bacteroidia bacterium]